MSGGDRRVSLDDVVRWFESLTRDSVAGIERVYAPDAYFKDPFNEVHGSAAIGKVFAHMFDQVGEPRFVVTERWQHESGAALLWDFKFVQGGVERLVRGASHLRFAPDGRIVFHRDYWDVAEELYEKVPLLGGVLRAIKSRLRA
jgi:hypothetical protein